MEINEPLDSDSLDAEQQGQYRVTVQKESAGTRLDRFLAEQIPEISRSRLKALIESDCVTCDGGAVKSPSVKILAGQAFLITLPQAIEPDPQPEDIPLSVIFEDEHLIVVDKPAGMVVHPAPGNYSGTLVNALLYHCGDSLSGIGGVKRPGIVHRIDKDTSGLLVIAKTDQAHNGLATLFSKHDIDRKYLAFVKGRINPSAGRVETMIARHPQNRKKMAVSDNHGKIAITHYRTSSIYAIGEHIFASLVECQLETGRTHQVRVHMAHLGHPLLGDPVYARPINIPKAAQEPLNHFLKNFNRQALHAALLGFVHPITGKKLVFESPLSDDLNTLKQLLSNP